MSKWLERWEAPTSDPTDDVGSPTEGIKPYQSLNDRFDGAKLTLRKFAPQPSLETPVRRHIDSPVVMVNRGVLRIEQGLFVRNGLSRADRHSPATGMHGGHLAPAPGP